MSIIASFMVPHPPLIVPEVGRGNENKVSKTISSYEEVAKKISELNPETIVISSPHAPYYSDWFYLPAGSIGKGTFAEFGAGNVSFEEEYDIELRDTISAIAREKDFPTGPINKSVALDHGSMVPLYFIRKYLPKCKILIVGLSTMSLEDNYRMGMLIKEAVNKLNRRVVYVASGDLSHKLQPDGPYGFAEEGPIYDKKIMEVCSKANFQELLEFDPLLLDKASECGHPSFTMMAGALDSENVETHEYSHEDITGVGYGIISFYPKSENKERNFLDKHLIKIEKELEEKKSNSDEYVKLARATIENYILKREKLTIPPGISEELLKKKAGVFVSIHKFGNLRGCIGTFLPTTNCIAEEIIHNAINAAVDDYRFNPITADELKWLDINVDVLSTPEKIPSKEELNPKRYGVIVTNGMRRGLLLPDLEGVDTVEEQIAIAKRKAGIKENESVELQRFEVIRHI